MHVRVKGISEENGGTTEVRVSDTEAPSQLLRYNYSSVANPPPNTSQVRTPSDDAPSTVIMWVHRKDYDNRDVKYYLMSKTSKGSKLYVQDLGNSDSRAVFTLTEDPIDEGDYITFHVEMESFTGTPLAGAGILISVLD